MITPPVGTTCDPRQLPGMLAQAPGSERAARLTALASLLLALGLWITLGSYAIPAAVLLGGTLVVGLIWPTPVQIGLDGVGSADLRGAWFVPFSEVSAVERARDFTLLRYSGGRLVLVDRRQRQLDERTLVQLQALVARCRGSQRPGFVFPARGSEPLEAWFAWVLERARPWLAADAGRAALLSVIGNPARACLERATAALILRPTLVPWERACIAEASGATAALPLQNLFRLALSGASTEDEIEEAFRALDRLERSPRGVARVLADVLG